jgi:hypothetical protein
MIATEDDTRPALGHWVVLRTASSDGATGGVRSTRASWQIGSQMRQRMVDPGHGSAGRRVPLGLPTNG